MTTLAPLVDILGWTAGLMFLGAYFLLSTGRLTGHSPLYQWANVVGAAGFMVNSGWYGALPSAVINGVWIMIGLLTIWQRHKSSRPVG